MECATPSIEAWIKNQVHTILVFATMNLKKLATWQWKHMSSYLLLYKNRQKCLIESVEDKKVKVFDLIANDYNSKAYNTNQK